MLIAGMLPLADALQKTGGTKMIVAALMEGVGDSGPRAMLTVIFFLTAALVVEPGRYGLMDFVKVGIPLLLLTYVVTLLVTPLVFPFTAS